MDLHSWCELIVWPHWLLPLRKPVWCERVRGRHTHRGDGKHQPLGWHQGVGGGVCTHILVEDPGVAAQVL